MNDRGFSVIAGVILGLVILSAVVTGGALIFKKPAEKANPFELGDLKVGDVVAGMRVVSIQPVNPRITSLSAEDNVSIKFSGRATVSGNYKFESMFLDRNILDLDKESQNKPPSLKGHNVTFLCLDDSQPAIGYKEGGAGTFVIDNFTLASYPSEGCSSATVIESREESLSIFKGRVEIFFEGKDVLEYKISYPQNQFTISSPDGGKNIDITEKLTGRKHKVTVSYEGGRGFTPILYWENITKPACSDCRQIANPISVKNAFQILTFANSNKEWIIIQAPQPGPWLLVAELQKPALGVERILTTIDFVNQ